ncbi:tryptophan synthase subunit alpha [Ignicoccus pacificus DSM 13166]|uniref:tryptophan synthase n=1 Tax=Ignicoccus pacificus DSM 13166 TaxID=940294 RepID=A0A977KAZ4_9CREN|nr:tryptophan synthase subunit alpha [Ignicoccus pacificus DSM 13166]
MLKVDPSRRPWLVAYLTLGYPDEEKFLKALEFLKDKAELIEVGIPPDFAKYDGPTIRRSYEVVRKRGISLENFEELLRKACEVVPPERLIAMTYYDEVKDDYEKFLEKVCAGGVLFADAIIDFVDEVENITKKAKEKGKDTVYFVSPTVPDHIIKRVAELSDPVLYLGVRPATGIPLPVGIPNLLERIRSLTDKPVVVGFGLKIEEVPQAIEHGASGIVVGSAFVKALGESFEAFEKKVEEYLKVLGKA